MAVHEKAGQPAPRSSLVNVPRLVSAYYTLRPDVSKPAQRVSFGTSGHRGSSFKGSFNDPGSSVAEDNWGEMGRFQHRAAWSRTGNHRPCVRRDEFHGCGCAVRV